MRKPSAPRVDEATSFANVYPDLTGESFRLKQISEIRDQLEEEIAHRDRLRRKYKTLWNVFYGTTQVSQVVAVASGGGAVGALVSGIGAPASIPLGGVSIVCGLISGACTGLGKAAMKKVEKHETIKHTAESSLNTVRDLVSNALMNGAVSNEDFHHILRELNNYKSHKTGIKTKTRSAIIELTAEREREIRAEAEEAGKKKALDNLITSLHPTGETSG